MMQTLLRLREAEASKGVAHVFRRGGVGVAFLWRRLRRRVGVNFGEAFLFRGGLESARRFIGLRNGSRQECRRSQGLRLVKAGLVFGDALLEPAFDVVGILRVKLGQRGEEFRFQSRQDAFGGDELHDLGVAGGLV